MARTDNFTNWATDVADSIRSKTGKTDMIPAANFDTEIAGITASGEINLQDKSIEITENGTTTITADEGYDGLKSIQIVINVSSEEPEEPEEPEEELNYINDGMIAWFDGYDAMDDSGHWNNRLGDDYIYTYYKSGTSSISHINNSYVNNKDVTLVTSADYYKDNYTIEVVGKINSRFNSDGDTGGWLLTMNETASWGIGVDTINGRIRFVNNDSFTAEKEFTDFYGKVFTGSLFINEFIDRGKLGVSTNYASVNGCDWFEVKETYNANGTSNGNNHPVLSYYARSGSKYMSDGAIHCIRIYNRKLTAEELAYNYEIDRKRFNF